MMQISHNTMQLHASSTRKDLMTLIKSCSDALFHPIIWNWCRSLWNLAIPEQRCYKHDFQTGKECSSPDSCGRLSSHAVPCHAGGDWLKAGHNGNAQNQMHCHQYGLVGSKLPIAPSPAEPCNAQRKRASRLTAQLHGGHKGVVVLLEYTKSREGWIDG